MPLLHIVTPSYMLYLFVTLISFSEIRNIQLQLVTDTQKLSYKSINNMALEHLCEVLFIRKSSRKCLSLSQILLQVHVSRLKIYGN